MKEPAVDFGPEGQALVEAVALARLVHADDGPVVRALHARLARISSYWALRAGADLKETQARAVLKEIEAEIERAEADFRALLEAGQKLTRPAEKSQP